MREADRWPAHIRKLERQLEEEIELPGRRASAEAIVEWAAHHPSLAWRWAWLTRMLKRTAKIADDARKQGR